MSLCKCGRSMIDGKSTCGDVRCGSSTGNTDPLAEMTAVAQAAIRQSRQDQQVGLAREVMAKLYAAGDERFVGESVFSIVMMWLDERVIEEDDPRIEEVTIALASLSADMEARRKEHGLSPTVVDPVH